MKLPQFKRSNSISSVPTISPSAFVNQGNVFLGLSRQAIENSRAAKRAEAQENSMRREDEFNLGLLKFAELMSSEKAKYAEATDEEGLVDTSILPSELAFPDKEVRTSTFEVVNGVPHERQISKIPAYLPKAEYLRAQARAHIATIAPKITDPVLQQKFILKAQAKADSDFTEAKEQYAKEYRRFSKDFSTNLIEKYKGEGRWDLAIGAVDRSPFTPEKRSILRRQILNEKEHALLNIVVNQEPRTPEELDKVMGTLVEAVDELSTPWKPGDILSATEQTEWAGKFRSRIDVLSRQAKMTKKVDNTLLLEDAEQYVKTIADPTLNSNPKVTQTYIDRLQQVTTPDGEVAPRAKRIIRDLQEEAAFIPETRKFGLQSGVDRRVIIRQIKKGITAIEDPERAAVASRHLRRLEQFDERIREAYERNTLEGGQLSGVIPFRSTDISIENILQPETMASLKAFNSDIEVIWNNGRGESIKQIIPKETAGQLAEAYLDAGVDQRISISKMLSGAFPNERLEAVIEQLTHEGVPVNQAYDIKIAAHLNSRVARQVMIGRGQIKDADPRWDNTQRKFMSEVWQRKTEGTYLAVDSQSEKIVREAATSLYYNRLDNKFKWDKDLYEQAIEDVKGRAIKINGRLTDVPNASVAPKSFRKLVEQKLHHTDFTRQGYVPVNPKNTPSRVLKELRGGKWRWQKWGENQYLIVDEGDNPLLSRTKEGVAPFLWAFGSNETIQSFRLKQKVRKFSEERKTAAEMLGITVEEVEKVGGETIRERISDLVDKLPKSKGERFGVPKGFESPFTKAFIDRLKKGKRPANVNTNE